MSKPNLLKKYTIYRRWEKRNNSLSRCLGLRPAPDTARTCNLQFRRLSLYPVELRVLFAAEVDDMAQVVFGKGKKHEKEDSPQRHRGGLGFYESSSSFVVVPKEGNMPSS